MYEIEFYETGKIKRVSGDSLSPANVELLISVASDVSRAAGKGVGKDVPSAEEEPCVKDVPFRFPALLDWHRREILHGRGTKFEDSPDLTGFQKNELALCQLETDYPLPPWFPDFLDWVWGLEAKQDKKGEWSLESGFVEAFGQTGLNKPAFLRRVALKLLLHHQKGWRWDPEEKRPIEGLVRSANPEHQVYVVQPRMMHGELNRWYPGWGLAPEETNE